MTDRLEKNLAEIAAQDAARLEALAEVRRLLDATDTDSPADVFRALREIGRCTFYAIVEPTE